MTLSSLFDNAPAGRMKAVRVNEDHQVFVADIPVPELADDEVLVKPGACGICGTDLHILHHGFPGTRYPVTPGHEFAGHVVAVGRAVKGIREGDFVAVDPNVTCGTCRWCSVGRPNLCPHLSPIGVARPGGTAEFVAAPARLAYKVHEALGAPVAAMIEPLACCLHAIESAQGIKDRNVLVIGGGTMGLLIAIAAELHGAGAVTIVDPSPVKREIAERAGIARRRAPSDLPDDERYEVVFEAAGVRPALEQAFRLTEKTGVLVQVGVHDADKLVPLNPFEIYEREIRIIGTNSLADKFPAAVDVMADLASRASVLIGETFPVWNFHEAAETAAAGRSVKTMLSFG